MIFFFYCDNGTGFSPVMSFFPCMYNCTNPTYWNAIHLSLMLYDVSNLQYLKIHVYCDVTRCLWVCCCGCFQGTTILWTVTPYAISDTVSHPTRYKFSNNAVRNSKLAIYSIVKSNTHLALPTYLLSQHTRHITHSLLYDERSLFYLTNIVWRFLQLFHHTSASSCVGHVNMTSYPTEVINNTCQMK
jgi:hypothetical protein